MQNKLMPTDQKAARAMTDQQDAEQYWNSHFSKVEGWVDSRHYNVLQVIANTQREVGITGHVGEIGVYHGKLLIGLAHLASDGDKVTAIDVFEDQSKNIDGAGVGSFERLQENIKQYGPKNRDYKFIKADSIALTMTDKCKIMDERGPFRLFSVDGCHTLEHTHADLLTAQEMLAPGGVMILDDFMQPHWPGVTQAANVFYSKGEPRVKPFLYCYHKLYFVGYGWHNQFYDAVAREFAHQGNVKRVDMFGSPVISIYP